MDFKDSKTPKEEITRQKYRINFSLVINQIKNDSNSKLKVPNLEFSINLCLVSPTIDIGNKITALTLKSFFLFNDKKYQEVFYILKKIENIQKQSNGIENFIFIRSLYRGAIFFFELQKYMYSFLYYSKCQLLQKFSIIDNESIFLLTKGVKECEETLQNQIHHKKDYFANPDIFTDSFISIIKRILDKKYEVDTNRDVYLVSAKWLKKAKEFFDLYIESRNNQDPQVFQDFILESFDPINIFENFSKGVGKGIFPMEIDNFSLIERKDFWIDPNNMEDNEYLKKNLKEEEDYELLNEEQWNKLEEVFGKTNEIKRNAKEIYLRDFKIIVFFPEMKNEKQWNMIKPKHIQISNTKTILDLKRKIMTSIFHAINFNGQIKRDKNEMQEYPKEFIFDDFSISFFSLLNNQKNLLFEIFLAYVHKIPLFHFSCSLIKIDDNESIANFPYLTDKILLVDIYEKNNSQKGFIKVKGNQCTNCKSKFKIEKEYQCEKCHYNTYCSENCSIYDPLHHKMHEEIENYLIEEFSLKNLFKAPLPLSVNEGRKGNVGLRNFGNTCYFNSFIQCLSHTGNLVKYFLLNKNEQEVNIANKRGSFGKLSREFSGLINELWTTNNDYISPSSILNFLFSNLKNVNYYNQQDAQEILSIFLDMLHEDLNRISNKPYIELKEKHENESDQEASERFWKNHKAREDSIIVDLFNGQTKTTIICPQCQKNNISFEPYMILTLNLLEANDNISFKFFHSYFNESKGIKILKCSSINMLFSPYAKAKDLKVKCMLYLKAMSEKDQNLDTSNFDVVSLNEKKIVERNLTDLELLSTYINNNTEICVFEKRSADCFNVFVYPVTIIKKKLFYVIYNKTEINFLSYPIPISICLRDSFKVLYEKILNSLMGIIDRKYIKGEFIENLFNLFIYHNGPPIIFNFFSSCEICNIYSSDAFCPLLGQKFNSSSLIKDLIKKFQTNRPLILLCTSKFFNQDTHIYPEFPFNSTKFDYKDFLSKVQTEFDLYDLLDYFQCEEKLDELNLWYCNRCKKLQEAKKKVELYRPSNYLIIHFKRFSMRSQMDNNNRKLTNFIKYPVETLDLRKYILGPEKKKAVYELYGSINHKGTLNSGHYTAYCKSDDLWFYFNDQKVEKLRNNEVVNQNAYLLFYRRKDLGKD